MGPIRLGWIIQLREVSTNSLFGGVAREPWYQDGVSGQAGSGSSMAPRAPHKHKHRSTQRTMNTDSVLSRRRKVLVVERYRGVDPPSKHHDADPEYHTRHHIQAGYNHRGGFAETEHTRHARTQTKKT